MKRIFYSICIVLSCVILNSCSSDEDPPTEEMMEQVEEDEPPFEESEPPSDFVIVVDSVGFDMASVTWTKPVGDNNNDLLYTVLLNGDIIAEDFTEREYSFSNLEFNTVYTLAVIAENTGGMSEAQTDFETLNPDNYSFLLRTFYRDDNYLRYEYQGNKVKRRTFGDEDLSFFTHEVNYNTNGKIASSIIVIRIIRTAFLKKAWRIMRMKIM